MKSTYLIDSFPICLHRNKLLIRSIVGDERMKHCFVFSYEGEVIISVTAYGSSFMPDCRPAYIELDEKAAITLSLLGINIKLHNQ